MSSLNVCHYCILLHNKSRVKNVLKYLLMKKLIFQEDFPRVRRTTNNYIFYPCSGHFIYAILLPISGKSAQDHTARQSQCSNPVCLNSTTLN